MHAEVHRCNHVPYLAKPAASLIDNFLLNTSFKNTVGND